MSGPGAPAAVTRDSRSTKGRWVVASLVTLALLAAGGLAVSAWLFSRWTRVRAVDAREAQEAFAGALARSGGGTPYIEITPEGAVKVHREQEGRERPPVRALHVVALEPERGQLVEASLPFWFVRAKLSSKLNAGTLTALLAGDWANLDLDVTEGDLQRRGPGLLLDHVPAQGGRLLIWAE